MGLRQRIKGAQKETERRLKIEKVKQAKEVRGFVSYFEEYKKNLLDDIRDYGGISWRVKRINGGSYCVTFIRAGGGPSFHLFCTRVFPDVYHWSIKDEWHIGFPEREFLIAFGAWLEGPKEDLEKRTETTKLRFGNEIYHAPSGAYKIQGNGGYHYGVFGRDSTGTLFVVSDHTAGAVQVDAKYLKEVSYIHALAPA